MNTNQISNDENIQNICEAKQFEHKTLNHHKSINDVGALIDSSSEIMTFGTAFDLKKKLFQEFQASDFENSKMIDFNELKNVLQTNIPSLTNELNIRHIFDSLEVNQDSKISYNEFLSDHNFQAFLKFCGYIVINDSPRSLSKALSVGSNEKKRSSSLADQSYYYTIKFRREISQLSMDEDINVRLQYKEDEISELKSWINDIGHPALKKLQHNQIKLDIATNEITNFHLKFDVLNDQIFQLKEENNLLSVKVIDLVSSEKIFDDFKNLNELHLQNNKQIHEESNMDELQFAYQALNEKYSKLKKRMKELKTINSNLKKFNVKYVAKIEELLSALDFQKNKVIVEKKENEKLFENMKILETHFAEKCEEIKEFERKIILKTPSYSPVHIKGRSLSKIMIPIGRILDHDSEDEFDYNPEPLPSNFLFNRRSSLDFPLVTPTSIEQQLHDEIFQLQAAVFQEKVENERKLVENNVQLEKQLREEIGKEYKNKVRMKKKKKKKKRDARNRTISIFNKNDDCVCIGFR